MCAMAQSTPEHQEAPTDFAECPKGEVRLAPSPRLPSAEPEALEVPQGLPTPPLPPETLDSLRPSCSSSLVVCPARCVWMRLGGPRGTLVEVGRLIVLCG